MKTSVELGGEFELGGSGIRVNRMGYGAMQLAGPHVFGPPKDRAACVAVLRAVVESGVNHIDTSDFYGPHVTNQIIKEALYPYKDGLTIVSKLGARRDEKGGWPSALSKEDLTAGLHDNLRNLGLERMDVVNLRVGGVAGPNDASIEEPLTVLAELQRQGLIGELGLSNVTSPQVKEGQKIARIVCVQNLYNVAHRDDDALLEELAGQGIGFVPFFPLGGFNPVQSGALEAVATRLEATPMQVALAWLLQRSPNMLLIPGTSSVGHLQENLAAATLALPEDAVTELDAISEKDPKGWLTGLGRRMRGE
jgi:aryl-alcohol dehydrogenase-like predicted oxidoreductase